MCTFTGAYYLWYYLFTETIFRYVKRLFNWFKHKEETEEDVYARWEKDYDLIPLSDHGLFYEYLELSKLLLEIDCTCT